MSEAGKIQGEALTDELPPVRPPYRRSRKRRLSFHQRQIRLLTLFFGALLISLGIAFLWWFNASSPLGR